MAISALKNLLKSDPKLKNTLLRFFAVYFLLVIILAGSGYVYFEEGKIEILRQRKEELSAVAGLKVNQLVNWRNERLADASKLAPVFEDSTKIGRLLKIKNAEKRNALFYVWAKRFYDYLEYNGIYLYSPSLEEIAFKSKNGNNVSFGKYELGLARGAVSGKQTVISDLYKNDFDNAINLDIYAPVIENHYGGARVTGLIILRIDPYKFLYPLIQSLPIETKTFETLIVRKEGKTALYLNKLRGIQNAPLTYFAPLDQYKSAAAMAAQGFEGVTEGINYLGNPVVAAIKAVPDSTWKLIAKIDREEVYAPVKRRALLVSLLVLCSLLAAGTILVLIWFSHVGSIYRKQFETEMERKIITKKYDYLLQYANIIIVVFDKDLRIIDANDKALSSYRYSKAEILQMNITDLMAAETMEAFADEFKTFVEKGSHIFKTVNKRKDGNTFPVEMNLQRFVIEWNEIFQAIIRDLS